MEEIKPEESLEIAPDVTEETKIELKIEEDVTTQESISAEAPADTEGSADPNQA